MNDAGWRALGAACTALFAYLLLTLELVLWQQAVLALLGWRYIDWFLGLFGSGA